MASRTKEKHQVLLFHSLKRPNFKLFALRNKQQHPPPLPHHHHLRIIEFFTTHFTRRSFSRRPTNRYGVGWGDVPQENKFEQVCSGVAPELVCFCFCICICICSLFPPNVYSASLNATFFTHIWPTFWIYHFYTIIPKFWGIKINFSTFMSWSIYFIAFLTIFVPQWEAIFYIFLFF